MRGSFFLRLLTLIAAARIVIWVAIGAPGTPPLPRLVLILNVLETKSKVEIVFHGLNPEDPEAKIEAFKEIIGGSGAAGTLTYQPGSGGQVAGSSSYYRWMVVGR